MTRSTIGVPCSVQSHSVRQFRAYELARHNYDQVPVSVSKTGARGQQE